MIKEIDNLDCFIPANDMRSRMIDDMIKSIQKKREKLIFDRLSKLGITIDINQEKHRRFKSLAVEYKDNEETIYYNDGSEQGLRIITFITKQKPFDHEKMSISCETYYY